MRQYTARMTADSAFSAEPMQFTYWSGSLWGSQEDCIEWFRSHPVRGVVRIEIFAVEVAEVVRVLQFEPRPFTEVRNVLVENNR